MAIDKILFIVQNLLQVEYSKQSKYSTYGIIISITCIWYLFTVPWNMHAHLIYVLPLCVYIGMSWSCSICKVSICKVYGDISFAWTITCISCFHLCAYSRWFMHRLQCLKRLYHKAFEPANTIIMFWCLYVCNINKVR